MPLKIDGPAGRQKVTDEYRKNYDRIFNGIPVCRCQDPRLCQVDITESCKHCTCSPGKSKSKDGGKNGKTNS